MNCLCSLYELLSVRHSLLMHVISSSWHQLVFSPELSLSAQCCPHSHCCQISMFRTWPSTATGPSHRDVGVNVASFLLHWHFKYEQAITCVFQIWMMFFCLFFLTNKIIGEPQWQVGSIPGSKFQNHSFNPQLLLLYPAYHVLPLPMLVSSRFSRLADWLC